MLSVHPDCCDMCLVTNRISAIHVGLLFKHHINTVLLH
jgi:hypothetical protein